MSKWVPGQKVTLAALPYFGMPEQRAEYRGPDGPGMHIVCLEKEYRMDGMDDGLRKLETADIKS